MKQATIRQHYYPEGGWGFVVVIGPSMPLPNNFIFQLSNLSKSALPLLFMVRNIYWPVLFMVRNLNRTF